MSTLVTAVIPARLGSKRFSGKVLHSYRGKPLLFYVWSAVSRSRGIDRLVIATDSPRIAEEATKFGAEVVRTTKKHKTGSDRVAEVAEKIGGDIIINIQADCFGLKAALLDKIITKMRADKKIECATLARRIHKSDELADPNQVKVVVSSQGEAFWFSRWPIPYYQSLPQKKWAGSFAYLGHIGIYFFRRETLRAFAKYSQSRLEKIESLEQLRLLENGHSIRVFQTESRTISIDRISDLKKLNLLYRQGRQNVQ